MSYYNEHDPKAAEAARLLTDAEVNALTWDFAPDWPEYAEIETAHNALCVDGPKRILD